MVQNNKVLTVSYGTFSCTLEGFDDSFDTMKAIAEYFRDLASDDRYFGAEPPQPDAEMLTRIAQREIDRQVEARTSDGAIHLRAAAPVVVSVPVPAEVEAPEQAGEADAPEQSVVEVASIPAVQITGELSPDLAEDVSQTPVKDPTSLDVKPVSDEAAPKAETPEPVEQQDNGIDLAAVAAAVATSEATGLPPVEDIAVAEDIVAVADKPDAGDDTVPAADSIAAKLQRIRAVVAQAPRDEEFSEDQHADLFISETAIDIAAAMRVGDDVEPGEESQDQPEIALALDQIDQRQSDSSTETAATDVETDIEVEVDAETEVETEADKPTVETAEDNDSLFEDLEDTSSSVEADSSDEDANILAEVAKHTESAAAKAENTKDKPSLRARIVRVKRADIDRAIESGALEEIVENAQQEALETSLSEADEADLLRELAAVEAELLATDEISKRSAEPATAETSQAAEAETEQETPAAPQTPTAARPVSDTPDNDVSRLMAAADEKLEDPESSSSRDTYDHLRAAMAAAQADRAAGGSVGSGVRDEAYREDLASVVRPRRPIAAKTASQRPVVAQRPAPLKLVAEQRIDEAPVKSSGPVRPRRIASSQVDDAEFADKGREGGFASYASESGAVELPELLEAAASYMSFVEGRDHFSRPQLMNKVKQLDSADFNREDGLRSFGLLLREGKIEKTNNGQFTVSGQIGFRPGQQATG